MLHPIRMLKSNSSNPQTVYDMYEACTNIYYRRKKQISDFNLNITLPHIYKKNPILVLNNLLWIYNETSSLGETFIAGFQ